MQGSYSWAYGLTSLSEKTRKPNHLQMLEQRQNLLLNYFKILSGGPAANRTRDLPHSRLAPYQWANQAAVNKVIVIIIVIVAVPEKHDFHGYAFILVTFYNLRITLALLLVASIRMKI